MLRPYIALTWALADYDDPIHVIWHDNKRVQRNGGEMFGNPAPALTCDPSGGVEAHASRHDLSEQMGTPSQANRHEVRPRTSVIEPAKPQ